MERLAEAGYVVDRMVSKCRNCDGEYNIIIHSVLSSAFVYHACLPENWYADNRAELGHISKNCPNERQERDKVQISCNNCKEIGHRMRDCPEPRIEQSARTCRNCNQPGHKASDCTEPRSAENVECRSCGESECARAHRSCSVLTILSRSLLKRLSLKAFLRL